MYSGKSRLKKNERINFLSSEVKFHSTEERKIERRRICFLKLKETIKDPQRNESITLEQHNLQTLVAIFRFNISTPLSLIRIVISLLHRTLISPIQKKTRSHQQFSPCLPPHLIFKPRDREYHLSNSSSKREWRWAVKAISKGWNTRLILSRIYGTA